MIGTRFHRLVVISEASRIHFKTTSSKSYLCKCDCGKEIIALPSNLMRGATKSCGCWKKETAGQARITHHKSNSPEYKIWLGIKKRCYNKNQKEFHLWGGKGIVMSDEWKNDFSKFLSDMGSRPSANHSIERIDSNGNYCKENCKWATDVEQSLNTTRTNKVTFNGELMSIPQLAKRIGKSYYTIYDWIIRRNHSVDDVLRLISGERTALNPRSGGSADNALPVG